MNKRRRWRFSLRSLFVGVTAAALAVDASACLAVEDSATGVASARAAGCFVVAVPCPSHPDPALGEAHLVLDSARRLLQRLP